jgi:hypothetical protein
MQADLGDRLVDFTFEWQILSCGRLDFTMRTGDPRKSDIGNDWRISRHALVDYHLLQSAGSWRLRGPIVLDHGWPRKATAPEADLLVINVGLEPRVNWGHLPRGGKLSNFQSPSRKSRELHREYANNQSWATEAMKRWSIERCDEALNASSLQYFCKR